MPKKIKIDKKNGILFWIEGFSGSGKTSLAESSKKKITNLFGPTIVLSGNQLRTLFDFKGYSKNQRINNAFKFSDFIKLITEQKINIIFTAVGLNYKLKSIYKKKINNFVEIFLSAKIESILIKKKKQKIYKLKKNIVGIDIKPEFPKNPHILINNNFDKSPQKLADELVNKIKKLLIN